MKIPYHVDCHSVDVIHEDVVILPKLPIMTFSLDIPSSKHGLLAVVVYNQTVDKNVFYGGLHNSHKEFMTRISLFIIM